MPFSNPYVVDYTGIPVPGIGNVLGPQFGHFFSRFFCNLSPLLSLQVMEDGPAEFTPLGKLPKKCKAIKSPKTPRKGKATKSPGSGKGKGGSRFAR
jgi:hypothetical protein